MVYGIMVQMKSFILLSFLVSSLAWAENFSAQDILTGSSLSIPSSKISVLVFLSAKCPCSASHEARLKTLNAQFKKRGVQFIGVHSNQDENRKMTVQHFTASSLGFPVVEDKEAKIADYYHVEGTPDAVVLQGNKVVFEGGMDNHSNEALATAHYLEDALNSILQNKPVAVAKTNKLGCAIKKGKKTS